jgi:hypothetical protein
VFSEQLSAKKFKEFLGVICLDAWRYERALQGDSGSKKWIGICNRTEELEYSLETIGVKCKWRWTSKLHAPQIIPRWGRKIVEASMQDYPISIKGSQKEEQVTGSKDNHRRKNPRIQEERK